MMKKTYQSPELEHIALETEEPVTLNFGVFSNIFNAADEGDLPEITEL